MKTKKPIKTRPIEMYVGIYQGDYQTWDTAFVDIPADTPDDKVEEVAKETLLKELEKQKDLHVAFVGVYCTNDDWAQEEDDDEED